MESYLCSSYTSSWPFVGETNSMVISYGSILFLIKFLVFVDVEYQLRIIFAHSTKYVPPSPSTRILLLSPHFYKYGDTLYIVTYFILRKKSLSPQVAYSLSLPSALLVPPEEMHGKWQVEILERSFHLGDLRVCQMIP